MGKIVTKKQLAQESADHPGQRKYRLYRKLADGSKEFVRDFWASGDAAAAEKVEIHRSRMKLVDPASDAEYFWAYDGRHAVDRGDGTVEIFDSLADAVLADGREESLWERFKTWCWLAKERAKDLRYAFSDFWFWYRHYDMRTNKSHQRFESWNLDGALLDMIEFNVPIIMRDQAGVPNEFCLAARAKAHEDEAGFDAEKSYSANPSSSKSEMEAASRMWKAELEALLRHVRLYRYYSDWGAFDEKDEAMAALDKEYRKTIPTLPGTDGEIDMKAVYGLAQAEWRAVWEWISRYGQNLWT